MEVLVVIPVRFMSLGLYFLPRNLIKKSSIFQMFRGDFMICMVFCFNIVD